MEDELISFNPSSFENEMTTEDEETPAAQAPVISGKNSLVNYRTFNDLESSTLLQSTTRLKALSRHNGLVHIRASLDAKPGYTVRVEGFNEMADGSYVITSVMHDYGEGGFSTYLQFGMNLQPYSTKFNLGAAAARPVIVNGLVTALQNDPDNLHRIQVKIAAWQHAQEPVWARLATPYAGDQYGLVLLPEIGDEVIVAFMGTDFDMPVVLGSAFSPNKPPHTAFSDDNHKKIFVTRKGMKWLWDDEKGIHEISTPGGNKILISEEEHAITITDENNNKIDMNQGAINLTGSKDISIKAAANLKLEGALVDIAASGTVKVKGSIVMIN
jgi:uncharacterized protein involved in type VI secretion and phage assembly